MIIWFELLFKFVYWKVWFNLLVFILNWWVEWLLCDWVEVIVVVFVFMIYMDWLKVDVFDMVSYDGRLLFKFLVLVVEFVFWVWLIDKGLNVLIMMLLSVCSGMIFGV